MYTSIRKPAAGATMALALVASGCSELPSAPLATQASVLPAAVTTSVVMSNLNSPRGLAWGPDGSLYVAEAGTTTISGPCATVLRGENCFTGTGSISRLRKGTQERVVTGLPAVYNPAARDIIGPNDIGFQGGRMLVSTGWGGPPSRRAELGPVGAGVGALLHVTPAGVWRELADIAAVEETNPNGGPIDSNPYGLLAEPSRSYVVDAGGNSLIEVAANGRTTVIATFPGREVPAGFPLEGTEAEAVPTEVTRGPDGALYVSTLTGVPFVPGRARVWRIVPGQTPTVFADGLSMITDIDWGTDGSLYVLQYASAVFFNGPGSVIRIAPDGTRTTIVSNLTNPTGILAAPDGALYVSNRGNVAGVGEVLRIVP